MKKWIIVCAVLCVAAFAEAGEKKAKGLTKEKYVARVKAKAETAGKEFDQAKTEANFDKRDINKDGILTRAERAAGSKKKKAE